MTITELIKKLEKAKEKYGDVQVTRYNYDYEQGDYHDLIKTIKLIKTDNYSSVEPPYIYLK
jgi:hypothetical protein